MQKFSSSSSTKVYIRFKPHSPLIRGMVLGHQVSEHIVDCERFCIFYDFDFIIPFNFCVKYV